MSRSSFLKIFIFLFVIVEDITAQGFSTTTPITSVTTNVSTGEKPQSKVWTHEGNWWAVLPDSSGTYLWKLDGTIWTSVLQISNSNNTHADVKAVGDTAYILLFKGIIAASAEFVRVQFSAGSYSIVSGGPGAEITINLDTGVETASIDIDSNGKLWVASDGTVDINVRWSSSPYTTWSEPIRLNDTSDVNIDDICAVTAFGGDKIGVIWSNQSAKRYGFKFRNDSDLDSIWQTEEVPASTPTENDTVGYGVSDDHLNFAVASDGTIYVATKTGYDIYNFPNVVLLVRRTNGSWDDIYTVQNNIEQIGTRPIVLLNESVGVLTVIFTEDVAGDDIVYKESKLSPIFFSNQRYDLKRSATNYDNVSSTKEGYTDEFVVIFSEFTDPDYNCEGVLAKSNFAAYYKMDEESGSSIKDVSVFSNDGSTTGAPGWVTGIDSLALELDGINDYVTVPDDASLDLSTGITLAAWIKSGKTGEQVILEKEDATSGYSLFLTSDGSLSVRFNGDETKRVNTSGLYSNRLDKWIHFAASYDGSIIRTYVNGFPDDSLTSTFTIGTNTEVLSIGANSDGSNKFMGLLDELKIFNSLISAADIKDLAAHSNTPTLVAHWAMEENGGITLIDSSSFKNNAVINDVPTWVEGKRGLALEYNGTNNYSIVTDDPSLNISSAITLAAWIKPAKNSTQRIIRKVDGAQDKGYSLFLNTSNKVSVRFNDKEALRLDSQSNYPTDDTTWMHIAATYDGTTIRLYLNGTEDNSLTASFDIGLTDNDLTIGGSNELFKFFDGCLDDVRIYNYALSSSEISNLQTSWSPTIPVTVNNGAGYALDFDGIDDFVNCGNNSSVNISGPITLEAWIKPDKKATLSILKKNGTNSGYELSLASDGKVFFRLNSNDNYRLSSASAYPTDGHTWIHVAGVYDGVNMTIYFNGNPDTSMSGPGSIATNNNGLVIGADGVDNNTKLFDGSIDEVRLWNVARTEENIQSRMCQKLLGNETGLTGYWQFDQVSGTTVDDLTSNNNEGIMNNMNTFNYVWSGSGVGDESVSDYVGNAGTYTAALSHPDGDQITATTTNGSGIQVYRVDATSMRTNSIGPENYTVSSSRYWGVRVFGSGTPTYTIVYDYTGHPGVADEANLKLVYRSSISDPLWEDVIATLDNAANTLAKTGQTGTEYALASFNGNPLPVELSFFTAAINGNKVELRWKTETEVNNYGFDVERSRNQLEWLAVGFVEGHGNSNSPKQYDFIDNDIGQSGKYYYRLRQIDNDGTINYSDIVAVEAGVPHSFNLSQNYPNPFNPETRIDFSIPKKQMVTLKVYNLLGEQVAELLNEEKDAGSYSVTFNGSNLASEVYFYRIETQNFTKTIKMILLK